MRYLFIPFLLLFNTSVMQSQFLDRNTKPGIVPFNFEGQYGFIDTLGNIQIPLGQYESVSIFDNLSFYLVRKEAQYELMDGRDGSTLEFGKLMYPFPIFKMYGVSYFHFQQKGQSIIVSPNSVVSYQLHQAYKHLEKYEFVDSLSKHTNTVIIATLENGENEVWMLEGQAIAKYKHIPNSKEIHIIYSQQTINNYPTFVPVGLAVATRIIPKKVKKTTTEPQQYVKPEKPKSVDGFKLYDFDLNHIGGVTALHTEALSPYYNHTNTTLDYQEKSAAEFPFPYAKSMYAKAEKLNEDFALQSNNDMTLNWTQNNKTVLSSNQVNFLWFIFNEHQIGYFSSTRYGENHFEAFIDFSGKYLPKNMLMLPVAYFNKIKEQELKVFMK